MATARLLRQKISMSQRVNALPLPARLLFTWMIPHLDVEGRMSGDPLIIKRTVFPLTRFSKRQIAQWLDLMEAQVDPVTKKGLIQQYEVDGYKYLWMPGFDSEQSQKTPAAGERPAWKNRETPSKIPPPPGVKDPPIQRQPKKEQDVPVKIDSRLAEMVKCYEENISHRPYSKSLKPSGTTRGYRTDGSRTLSRNPYCVTRGGLPT